MPASWRKVVVSGSSPNFAAVQVDNLTSGQVVIGGGAGNLTTQAVNGTGNIVATTGATAVQMTGSFSGSFTVQMTGTASYVSGAIFTSANPALSASYAVTASYALSAASAATPFSLAYGVGLTGSATTFNGGQNVTFTINTGSTNLITNSIQKWTGTGFTNSNLHDSGTAITGSVPIQLTGATSALTGSFTGSFVGALTGTASYATKAVQTQGTLTLGNGLTGTSFDGSANVTAAVGAGALIQVAAGVTNVNTSSLSSNQIPKYSGNTLSGSNITDTGAQVQIAATATSGLKVFAGGVTVTGNSTFDNDVTVTGNLSVAGTASFQNTQNLLIADKFILLNSGSTSLSDSGIIITTAGLSGSAIYLEAGAAGDTGPYGRFAVQYNVNAASASISADEYMVTAKLSPSSNPSNTVPPTWGTGSNGGGNLWIRQDTGDIYIWA